MLSFFLGSSELNSSPASHNPPQGLGQRWSSFWSERGLCLLLSSTGTSKWDEPEYSSTVWSSLIQLLWGSSWSSKAWASMSKSLVTGWDTCKLDLRLRSVWEGSLWMCSYLPLKGWWQSESEVGKWGTGEWAERLARQLFLWWERGHASLSCATPSPTHLFLLAGTLLLGPLARGEVMWAIYPSPISETHKGVEAKLQSSTQHPQGRSE